MPRGIPHTTYRRIALPKPLQAAFDAYVEAAGCKGAARAFDVSPATVEKLLHGGSASPESVARVAMRLAEASGKAGT